MSALEKIIRRQQTREEIEEGLDREIAEGVFKEWRDRYVAYLCAYIRTYAKAKEIGTPLPEPMHTPEWCNAAVHILTVAERGVQDRFLRSNLKHKSQMVQAVLDDGGVTDFNGRFVELPVL